MIKTQKKNPDGEQVLQMLKENWEKNLTEKWDPNLSAILTPNN